MFKKQLAVAIGSALALGVAVNANAAPTVYGSARVVLESCATCVGATGTLTNDDWELRDAGSRVGVKGSEDIGGNLSAVYNFEFAVDVNDGVETNFGGGRPHYVGVKGDFGTVTFGRQYNPYYDFIRGKLDIFNENWDYGVGINHYTSRTSDLIKYVSPTMSGVTVEAGVVTTGNVNGEDVDQTHLGVSFAMGPFSASVARASEKLVTSKAIGPVTLITAPADDFDVTGVVAGFKFGPAEVKAGFQRAELGSAKAESTNLVGEVQLGANGTLLVGYETMEIDGSTSEPSFSQIEYQHKLSKPVRVWAALINRDLDTTGIDEDPTIQLGMRVDF